ncbi:MAG: hypothetical protein ACYS7Y_04130 [Planctomycetota bacterium]|jgi:hypothetical protein
MLSKITTNKARRLGFHLVDDEFDTPNQGEVIRRVDTLEGFEICADDDGEPADEFCAAYVRNADGSFRYWGSCSWRDNDLPAHIASEQALRDLLPEIAKIVS